MNHIVVISDMFTIDQRIQVYQDGECKSDLYCKMWNLEKTCYTLCKQYGIKEISFHGVPFLGEKLQKELRKNPEFNDFNINVTLV